nr:MAG TPA: hypothetical protein [Caudoviricetes sp.]
MAHTPTPCPCRRHCSLLFTCFVRLVPKSKLEVLFPVPCGG